MKISELWLYRIRKGKRATLGILQAENLPPLFTIEPPWMNNEQLVSCIPVGTYDVKLTYSLRFKRYLPEIMNVPGRTAIKIHAGNWVRETSGCILVGRDIRSVVPTLVDSLQFERFLVSRLSKDGATIHIEELKYGDSFDIGEDSEEGGGGAPDAGHAEAGEAATEGQPSPQASEDAAKDI